MATGTDQTTKWDIKRLLDWTTGHFAKSGVDQGRLAAEMLLGHVLKCQRIELYTRFDYCPDPDEMTMFRDLVKRGAAHEPIGYLTNSAWFYSLELSVSSAVLIPRAETEVLVSEAIDYLRTLNGRESVGVLDLCCGSGCVAIAIAKNTEAGNFIASDLSGEALEVAGENVKRHELDDKIQLVQSDLFEGIDIGECGAFDLIVSNPPYISDVEFAKLDANVKDYEPRGALYGGADGLDYYRQIVEKADGYLTAGGKLMVEIGYDQGDDVAGLFEGAGYLQDVLVVKDSLGHPRIVVGRK